jgi:hypothetical protein
MIRFRVLVPLFVKRLIRCFEIIAENLSLNLPQGERTRVPVTSGLVCSKLIALLLGWWVRKRLWMVNLFYAGIVCWNLYVLVVLSGARH